MRKISIIPLFYALYVLIAQTAPLGSSTQSSIDSYKQWVISAVPDTYQSREIPSQREFWQHGYASLAEGTPPIITTTRTVTSTVTHIAPWLPTTNSNPSTASWLLVSTTSAISSNINAPRTNNTLSWKLEEQPPAAMTTTSILYVATSLMCISIIYLIVHMVYTLTKHSKIRRYCCFCTKKPLAEKELRSVELEESAGVSWTEGSNLTTPHPEMPAPEVWCGSWADMVVVGGAEAFGSTGRAGIPPVGGTVRRKRKKAEEGSEFV